MPLEPGFRCAPGPGLRAARGRGQALACPLFLPPRGRRGSGVNGRPKAVARKRDAQHPLHRRDGPVACAAPRKQQRRSRYLPKALDTTNKEESLWVIRLPLC
jgi:hypothetical protein